MKKLSGYLVGFTLLVGLAATIGWLLDCDIFTLPFSQSVVMLPVTCISIIMGSVSFFLLCKFPPGKKTILAGRILAAGVLFIGLLKLSGLAGIETGLNHWPFSEKYVSSHVTVSIPLGVAVINSALGFIITGLALLLTNVKGLWPGRIVITLAFIGYMIGSFAYVGFLYQIKEFYGILPYMSVAPSTALCFICFSLGILFENSDKGFMETFNSPYQGGRIVRLLIPIGVLVPFISGYLNIILASKISFSGELGIAALNMTRMVIVLFVSWLLAKTLNKADEDRRKAEALLEQQAILFNIMPDAVVYGNPDFTVTGLNPVAKRIFKVADDEIGRVKLDELFTPDATGPVKDLVQKDLWGEKGFWRGESDFTTRAGQKLNVLAMFKAVANAEGEKISWLAVYTDIGPLRLNEELKLANSYLEQLAFISAHDIKAPILTLKGLVDMMYSTENIKPSGLQIMDMQKKVVDEMQLINNALNDILKLRANLKAKDINPNEGGSIALNNILSNITGILRTELESSGATFKAEMNGVSAIKFPQVYFQSLFYNLLSNSIKYRSAERPLVVQFTAAMVESNTVKFIIEDNGLGFDTQQNKNKIYGIFKRFHAHVEGTGVGLHIVKSIVDAFNGQIKVESEPDAGTRFELTFKIPAQG